MNEEKWTDSPTATPPSPPWPRFIRKGATQTLRRKTPHDESARKDEDVEGGGSVADSDNVVDNGDGTDDKKSKQARSKEEAPPATGSSNVIIGGGSVADGGQMLGTPSIVPGHREGTTPTIL